MEISKIFVSCCSVCGCNRPCARSSERGGRDSSKGAVYQSSRVGKKFGPFSVLLLSSSDGTCGRHWRGARALCNFRRFGHWGSVDAVRGARRARGRRPAARRRYPTAISAPGRQADDTVGGSETIHPSFLPSSKAGVPTLARGRCGMKTMRRLRWHQQATRVESSTAASVGLCPPRPPPSPIK